MSRTDFHLNAAWLGTQVGETSGDETPAGEPPADKRFAWDTFWGGSIDFIDYVNGRIGIVIDGVQKWHRLRVGTSRARAEETLRAWIERTRSKGAA